MAGVGVGVGREKMPSCLVLNGSRTSFEVLSMFWKQTEGWLHRTANVINAKELYTLMWINVCYRTDRPSTL